MPEPSLSCAIERGAPSLSRLTIARRVLSPRAAKTRMGKRGREVAAARLSALPDMGLDVLHLFGPAAVIHAHRLKTAPLGNLLEPRLDQRQHRAAVDALELELDQRGWLPRIVDGRVDRVRVPGEREVPFVLHAH